MYEEIIAEEILKILMESGAYRSREVAVEVLQSAPTQWLKDLEEEASYAVIVSLQDSLKEAIENKNFERAQELKEQIKEITEHVQ